MAAAVNWRELAREFDAAIANVDDAVGRRLESPGIPGELLRKPRSMVGITHVRPAGPRLYEPAEIGPVMYVSPVLISDP